MPAMIPVCRPLLPDADRLMPYLRRIDETRIYSNQGPLLGAFEHAFAASARIDRERLSTVANGTLALSLALLSEAGPPLPGRDLCLMPSCTFVAAAAAVRAAGYTPCFMDVEAETAMPDLHRVERHGAGSNIGAIILVGAFGALPDLDACAHMSTRLDIPVIIDAAACTDAFLGGHRHIPQGVALTFSFHATKPFALGEGGALVSSDAEKASVAARLRNFGFDRHRHVMQSGMNAKLSEYAAAVGLAQLEAWDETRASWMAGVEAYHERLETLMPEQFRMEHDWVTPYPQVMVSDASALSCFMADHGIETRSWWPRGCHQFEAYAFCPQVEDLPVTETLTAGLLGLPFFVDMTTDQIDTVARALQAYGKQQAGVGTRS